MNNSVQQIYKPEDLIKFLDTDSEFAGIVDCPTVIYNIGLLGEEANGIFGQVNEALYRKDSGWEKRFEEGAKRFEKIAGFRPEEVYRAEAQLCKSKELAQPVDRWGNPFLEGLDILPKLRTKEG